MIQTAFGWLKKIGAKVQSFLIQTQNIILI
jgi:hypothetical protein